MKVLVTGHTGSLGTKLVRLLLEDGHEVIGASRDEFRQATFPYADRMVQYLCDVRDRDRLLEASRGVELVFHAAAMKRVETCEKQPEEAHGVNVIGTHNVLHSQRMNKIQRVVFISTDKACAPITAYGTTKRLAENFVLTNPNSNVVVRYGNCLASRGSVLSTFVNSIKEKGTIEVTDVRCSRFWWTLEEAATYVYLCSKRPHGGLFIPNLRAYPVVGLGNAVAKVLGLPKPRVVEVGFRCIEKVHEDMRTSEEGGRLNSGDQDLWYEPREIEETLRYVLGAN